MCNLTCCQTLFFLAEAASTVQEVAPALLEVGSDVPAAPCFPSHLRARE